MSQQPKLFIMDSSTTATTHAHSILVPDNKHSLFGLSHPQKLPDLEVVIKNRDDDHPPPKRKHSSASSTNDHKNNTANRSSEHPLSQNNLSSLDIDPDSAENQHLKKLTTEKRKAQNRAAQRNFRERKEKQCKQNEENLIIRTEENKKMRELITSLEAENSFLRQHVPESVLEQARKSFPRRPELSTIVIPIPAYNEFLGPEQKSTGAAGPGGLSESEEHARAATALSSLAAAPIDPVFDPQLQHLAGPSPSAALVASADHHLQHHHQHQHQHQHQQQQLLQPDLIVPSSTDDPPSSSSANTPSIPASSTFSHPDHLLHSSDHHHHHQHQHHQQQQSHHHHSHPPTHHHQQFDHHQNLLHDKIFVDNHHS
ncbi:hypothetical protein PTTG_06436, partial [Puccinia triticina 1-1 BBBD Race 1]